MNIAIGSYLDLKMAKNGEVETSAYPEDAVAIGLFSNDGVIREWGEFPEWVNAGSGAVDEERLKRGMEWLTGSTEISIDDIRADYIVRI